MASTISEILSEIQGKRVLVIGDIMLDHDVYLTDETRFDFNGTAPVYKVEHEDYKLGGAANVAANVVSLGGIVQLIGLVGTGNQKSISTIAANNNLYNLYELLRENSGWTVVFCDDRPTTIKRRYYLNNEVIMRVDQESDAPYEDSQEIIEGIYDNIDDDLHTAYDAVIFADYDKGCITPTIIRHVVEAVNGKIPIVADPKHRNFLEYEGITAMTPNGSEVLKARESYKKQFGRNPAPFNILEVLSCDHMIVTDGEKGCRVYEREPEAAESVTRIQVAARSGMKRGGLAPLPLEGFVDSCGAGDTFTAAFTLGLTVADVLDSAEFANRVAGVSCKHRGSYAVKAAEVLEVSGV